MIRPNVNLLALLTLPPEVIVVRRGKPAHEELSAHKPFTKTTSGRTTSVVSHKLVE